MYLQFYHKQNILFQKPKKNPLVLPLVLHLVLCLRISKQTIYLQFYLLST